MFPREHDDRLSMRHLYLLSFLFVGSVWAKPCGLNGSIDERITECATTKGSFAVVTTTEKGAEFYKDTKTKLIWGSRITSDFNHYGSQKACVGDVSEYPAIANLKWRLPTIREFEQAAANGMKAAFQNSENSYWSSTPVKKPRSRRNRRAMPAGVFVWEGLDEKTSVGDLKDGASVRCVSKE